MMDPNFMGSPGDWIKALVVLVVICILIGIGMGALFF